MKKEIKHLTYTNKATINSWEIIEEINTIKSKIKEIVNIVNELKKAENEKIRE